MSRLRHQRSSIDLLQRCLGNRGAQLWLGTSRDLGGRHPQGTTASVPLASLPGGIQAKLLIDTPGDRHEREAELVADRVVRGDAGRADSPGALARGGPPPSARAIGGDIESRLRHAAGPGRSLPSPQRETLERRIGADFRDVRVHHDGPAGELNHMLGARAFTRGHHVFFGRGEYQPHTRAGLRLLAHELTHTVQQRAVGQPLVQRDLDDPTRFETTHRRGFSRGTGGGGGTLTWVPGPTGTRDTIVAQAITELERIRTAEPVLFTPPRSGLTSEASADTAAIAADQRIRNFFPYITTARTAADIRASVTVFGRSDVAADRAFLHQWLANKLIGLSDIERYNIAETDPEFIAVLDALLDHATWGPRLINLAARGAGHIDPRAATRVVRINRGAPAVIRNATLIHEMTHFYAHPEYKTWILGSNSSREYDEGLTEYLARQVMTDPERDAGDPYRERVDRVRDVFTNHISNDDVARVYFLGEVWRVEANTAIARRMFERDTGLREGADRATEVAQSASGAGIVQIVEAGRRYRFMNYAVGEVEPKPQHLAAFRAAMREHVLGRPGVRIRFVGHASDPGGRRFNERLSQRRARRFYEIAAAEGVPAAQLADAGDPLFAGETAPNAPNTTVHGRALNRRVELFIIHPIPGVTPSPADTPAPSPDTPPESTGSDE